MTITITAAPPIPAPRARSGLISSTGVLVVVVVAEVESLKFVQ